MGLNSHERFENCMNIASSETVGDAEKAEVICEDIYDDMFEERLSYVANYNKKIDNISSIKVDENDKIQEEDDKKEQLFNKELKKFSASAYLAFENKEMQSENEKEQKDIVFTGIAVENPRYGAGGGNQYFIRDFGEMKQDGRMIKSDEKYLNYTGTLIGNLNKESRVEKQKYKFTYSIDTKELSEEEEGEWKQLNVQTRDEQGLSKVRSDAESQKVEDRKNPWSNQEDSNGTFFPDAYSNPRELQKGELYYQLRPIDAVYESPYLTDKKTIDSCRGINGEVDVEQLLRKLQIMPSNVREYVLREYIYQPREERNKL